jgi:ABC-type nickel/cobalt efflux system permease component RcnA
MRVARAGLLALVLGLFLATPAPAWLRQGPGLGFGARPGAGSVPAGEAQPAWLRSVLARVNVAQRQLNQTLSRELRQLREGDMTRAGLTVAWIAFLYGVLHAIGPGHGKMVVSSLFVARDVRLGTAIGISGLVSLLQAVSSIAIVSVVALVLGRGGLDVLRDSRRVELVCYGLIVLIGVTMLAAVLREVWVHRRAAPSAHAPVAERETGRPISAWLVLVTGLTPCASAVIVLLFALGQGVYLAGVAAALVMAVGMGLTVSLVGLLAVAARRGAIRAVKAPSDASHWLKDILAAGGAAAIAGVGLLLFLAAWTGA